MVWHLCMSVIPFPILALICLLSFSSKIKRPPQFQLLSNNFATSLVGLQPAPTTCWRHSKVPLLPLLFFVISGGMVCQYQRANPPPHLTTSPNPPDPAATLMMMIVECANLLNHSYFPAVCSWCKKSSAVQEGSHGMVNPSGNATARGQMTRALVAIISGW